MPVLPEDAKKAGSGSPGKKSKPRKSEGAVEGVVAGKHRGSSIIAAEDRDFYQEPIKKIIKPSNQVPEAS